MESYFPNHKFEEVDIDSIVKKKRRSIVKRRLRYLTLISSIGILCAMLSELMFLFIYLSSDQTTIGVLVTFLGIPAGFLVSLCNKDENLLIDIRDSFFSSIICSISFIILHLILKVFSYKFPSEMIVMFYRNLILLFFPLMNILFSFPWGAITSNFLVKRLKRKLQKAKHKENIQ